MARPTPLSGFPEWLPDQRMIELRVLGLATIAEDVDAELALATIGSVEVLGAFRAPRAVKAALAPRTT